MHNENLRTDEIVDFVCSLNWAKLALEQTANDQASWKWVVLSTHSALQGALVCHLSGTAHLGALQRGKTYDKWFAWKMDEVGQEPRRPYLAELPVLVERLQSKRTESAGSIIVLNSEEQRAIDIFHDYRNQFTHFHPQRWSIKLDELPPLVNNVFGVIAKIAADPWTFRRATDGQRQLISQMLAL